MQEYSMKETLAYLAGRIRSLNELLSMLKEGANKKDDVNTIIRTFILHELKELSLELPNANKGAIELIEDGLEGVEEPDGLDKQVDAASNVLERIAQILHTQKEE